MSLYDVQCHTNLGHTMVYDATGKLGAGFYCTRCDAVELDETILASEDLLADQLKRRIIR